MSAVIYVAYQNTAEAWDVCRVEDLAGHCEFVSQPIIFGLRTEQAFEYVAKLNDDLQWAKQLSTCGSGLFGIGGASDDGRGGIMSNSSRKGQAS